MKDLRIVIVSWNVQDHLGRCLESLPQACVGLDWDCMVVDNHSSDKSVELVKGYATKDERIDVIANETNRGFAFACNQGAMHHGARYVLLLNPDTDCPSGSLAALVAAADRHPEAGVIGPKLTYPNGQYQPSAQRFPTLRDQSLILLKLHHIFPGAASLRRYFFQDLEKDKAQTVDQVMGACFLVRSAFWDQIHGMDQRYFIWFEEVDMCRQADKNGWKVWYEPSVTVIHHEGQAFAQVFSLKRQSYFNDSLRKYMRKWHGYWAWLVVTCLHPVSLAMAAIITPLMLRPGTRQSVARANIDLPCQKQSKMIWRWIFAILGIELLSALAQGNVTVQIAGMLVVFCMVAVLAYRSPAAGLAAVGTELIIGGLGHLLELPAEGFAKGFSLRMAIMAAFFLGWVANAIKDRVWRYWKFNELIILQSWVFVAGMILGALIRGLQLGQEGIFNDLNAWIFLLYFVPVLDVAHRNGRDLMKQATGAFIAGLLWMCFEMLLVFALLSHVTPINGWLYTWIRDTRVGELTPMNGLYRVFFQSSIYAVFGYLLLIAWWLEKGITYKLTEGVRSIGCFGRKNLGWIVGLAGSCALLISLSRSFWLGVAFGSVCIVVLALWAGGHAPYGAWRGKKFGHTVLAVGISGTAALVLIMILTFFPWPKPKVQSLTAFFANRTQMGDAAGSSRWALWPVLWQQIRINPVLGQGFGSAVTYKTQDPRILEKHPDGMYTTRAFEWGWLGLWIKFGIFGPLIMLWLLVSLGWRTWKSKYAWWLRAGVIGGMCALATVHVLTPYLDHPLGFGWLLAVEGMLAMEREANEPSGYSD
jgi:GT2 family glycosyltransferase